jgi:hypothetical protein
MGRPFEAIRAVEPEAKLDPELIAILNLPRSGSDRDLGLSALDPGARFGKRELRSRS